MFAENAEIPCNSLEHTIFKISKIPWVILSDEHIVELKSVLAAVVADVAVPYA